MALFGATPINSSPFKYIKDIEFTEASNPLRADRHSSLWDVLILSSNDEYEPKPLGNIRK